MASGILGSKTGDFLTWVTIVLVGIFLSLGVLMAKFYKPSVSDFGTEQTTKQEPTKASTSQTPTDVNQTRTTDINESKKR